MVKFSHSIVVTSDLAQAKEFYVNCLQLEISNEFENCFLLANNDLLIHEAKTFSNTVYDRVLPRYLEKQGRGNLNIYFETDELEAIQERLESSGYALLHPIKRQPWRQRVLRAFDPDMHIVEIGEPLFKWFN